tara:strand:+ start:785 stop:961 length:177 start_codon:yes stop_codon:yes gene_type:complete
LIFEEFKQLPYYPLDGAYGLIEVRTNITTANNAIVEGYFTHHEWPLGIESDLRDDGPL